ncbi:MAG: metalloregulator ArsR/SmtB family transcription factor [Rhodocyclales bacterium]|nr:metalloregulator ArsR/SmtB family transcription factor [Rhodocyclales bacterium]
MTRGACSVKKALSDHFAQVGKALGQGSRLELLEALAQGERSVDALAQVCAMPISNTSHHLQILRDAGLLASRKTGLQVFYRIADEEVLRVIAGIRGIAQRQQAEVGRIVREHYGSRDEFQPVPRGELIRLVRNGEAIILDVRPEGEFISGHIPGAVNIPLDQLTLQLKKLPKSLEVVAYCRGPFCWLSFEAVELLRKKGYRARRLEEGYPEWKANRLPVESGTLGVTAV